MTALQNISDEDVRPLLKLSDCPSVWLAEEFLSEEECNLLITMAKGKLRPSTTFNVETGEDMLSEGRTSSLTCFKPAQDNFIAELEDRLADLSNLPVENGEGLQILNYQIGQEYRPHFDFFDPMRPGTAKTLRMGGQRVMTILMYLNTVEAGGETVFPEVGLQVRPQQGDALIFYNLYGNGEIDPLSLHASAPVIRGEKWVATKWIREAAFEKESHR